MRDYLKNLVARTLDPSSVVQPRLASRFEPHAGASGAVTDFDFETEVEASPAAPPVETRAQTRRTSATTPAESVPRTPAEQSPPPLFERRPDLSSHERAPGPSHSQTFTNKETPKPTAAHVEAWAGAARVATPESVPEVRRGAQPSPESAEQPSPGLAERQTSRTGPHVVEPRLSPMPKVFEAQPPQASHAAELSHDDAAPTIRVTIGRVDVRAVASGSKETRRAPAQPRPALTLEDYLKRRGGGSR